MMKTHCPKGHLISEENTAFVNAGKSKPHKRRCRACLREKYRRYKQRKIEQLRPKNREYGKTFYRKNPEKVKLLAKQIRVELRTIVLNHYGATCACCGETIREFLCLDHINNNGNKHRKEIKSGGGVTMYRWLIKNAFPPGFQLLCYNCNSAKAIYGICPHSQA